MKEKKRIKKREKMMMEKNCFKKSEKWGVAKEES